MARASFGFATPLSSSLRHLTHHPFTLVPSKPFRFSPLRAATSAMLDSSGNCHPSLEIVGGAVDKFLPAFKTLHLPYTPYPLIAWNRHVETIFAAFFRSLPNVKFRRECLRARDDGAVSLDWVSGDDRNLPLDAPVLILLPGLTGGSDDTYVRHMLLRARSKGWRAVVFNSRGCGDSPVITPQFYSASFLGDISEVVDHVGNRYPRANLYAVGWSLGANTLVRYVGQESFSCPLAGAVSLCNPFNLVIADEDFRKGFNIVYDKALANALCKIFRRHALLFEDIGGKFNIPLAANAKSVREFDEGLTRVSFGFKSVDDYYSNSSSSDSIKNVSIPLLCIQAENDPIAPSRGVPRDDIKKNPNSMLIVTPKGGHLGWVAGGEAPFGAPWTDPIVMDFLEHLESPRFVSGSAHGLHQLEGGSLELELATHTLSIRSILTMAEDRLSAAKTQQLNIKPPHAEDPAAALANARKEFGEHGGVNMSIEPSVTFTVMESDLLRRVNAGELGPDDGFFVYSRQCNPTVYNLGRLIAALEGTEAAYCTASGMSAISSVLLHLCSSGEHVVASRTLYGGTHALLTRFLPRACNITTSFVDIGDLEMVRREIVEGRTKVLYFESMSNPVLSVANVPELCRIAHDKGVTVVVDNTFAPMLVSPARLGADVVIQSISKFICGGADIIAGAVCGPASLLNSMMEIQGTFTLLGPAMNPKVAFEISERLPHLGLRMKEHCRRALEYATRMKKLGVKVIYPGLEDHPDHALLKSIANLDYGYGGVLCVDMETEEKANRFMNLLQNSSQFGLIAVSLGYYDTLMSCSGSTTSSELSKEEKALSGISAGLVRMSIGYSGTLEQKWSQFEKALSQMKNLKI